MSHEQNAPTDPLDTRLAALFAAYREACPDPESSPDFMPRLWRKIEAQQSLAYNLRRFARGLITAAAAAALLMGVYLARLESRRSPFYTNTYLELLAADQSHDSLADTEIVQAVHERAR